MSGDGVDHIYLRYGPTASSTQI